MGVINYLNETKKSRYSRRDNIELLRPIVNVFVGNFGDTEKKILMDTLSARVGNSKKIHYCEIKLGMATDAANEEIYQIHYNETECDGQYDLKSWDVLFEQAEKSEKLKKDAMDLVKYVFNEASKFVYDSKSIIRLNYIIQADWVGTALLESLVKVFNRSFSEYYSNGVDTDLYCILDQQGHTNDNQGEERKALNFRTLTTINRIAGKKEVNPAYILSNYTSRDCLDPERLEEQIETIALHMIIKDGKASRKTSKNTSETLQRQFSEKNFIEAARAKGGNFCTIGKLNLEVDNELRDWVVYKTVFADFYRSDTSESIIGQLIRKMEVDKDHFEARIGEVFQEHIITESVLYPMVFDSRITPADFLSESHESMVKKLYGKELDYFWQVNFAGDPDDSKRIVNEIVKQINATLNTAYHNSECSLTEAYQTIAQIEHQFKMYVGEYKQLAQEMNIGFEEWKNEKCNISNLRDTVRETNALRAGYTLACQYLDKYTAMKQVEKCGKIAECCLREIQNSTDYYRGQSDTIKEAMEELQTGIREREQRGDILLCGNMCDYYTRVTEKWMRQSEEYAIFFRTVNNQICKRELSGEDIYRRLIQFCDEKILSDACYSDDIAVEMLSRLKGYENLSTDEDIYKLAFDTIIRSREYFVNHTRFDDVYEAVCLLVKPENAFVNSINDQMNRLQRNQQLQWFFEEHNNGMDVIFLEGCFEVSTIYQYSLYKRVDEHMKQEIRLMR